WHVTPLRGAVPPATDGRSALPLQTNAATESGAPSVTSSYDFAQDLGEARNLAAEHLRRIQARAARLRDLLKAGRGRDGNRGTASGPLDERERLERAAQGRGTVAPQPVVPQRR